MNRQTLSNITVRKRLIFFFICIAALVFAFICRLGWLQLVHGQELREKAWEQWTRTNVARAQGNIYDRNGEPGGRFRFFSILARPGQIADKKTEKAAIRKWMKTAFWNYSARN